AHATLEPQNSIVSYQDDKVEVWSPCQSPSVIQDEVAAVTGVSSSDVLVHTTLSGGAFGRRTYPEAAVEAARISKKLKRPVQVVWSRENDMTAGRYRPAGASHIEGSVKSGKLHSLRIHNLVQVIIPDNVMFVRGGLPGALPNYAKNINVATIGAATRTNTQIDIPALEGIAETPYQIPNFRAEFTPVFTDIPVAFWRAVGHSHNGFIMESAIDELAALADVDPYQFRRLLLKNGTREMRVLDAVAKLSSWSSPAQDGFAKGIARHTSFGSEVAQVAEAGIVGGRIKVRKVWAVVDCGIAINPDVVKAQIESSIIFGLGAALDQQINIRNGVPQQKNYDTFPMTRMFESPEIEVEILD
ncbi:MAG: molybdopterin cofactor-binding domain-containing protein, partial [Myxococcota bacterium]